jgi:membrane-associated phospholipid phosphatase
MPRLSHPTACTIAIAFACLLGVPEWPRSALCQAIELPKSLLAPDLESSPEPLLQSRDLVFAAQLAALSFGTANLADHWAWDELPESNGAAPRRLSSLAGRLATPAFFGTALAGAYFAGKVWDDPSLSSSALRIGASVAAASGVSGALKYAIGRSRPGQAPDDGDLFRPFSGSSSFPSGHTTAAFALASAIDQETEASWVPWVAYPVAGLVGWSRIRDDKHWMSDVVAGALIGSWVSHKVMRLTGGGRDRAPVTIELGFNSNGPEAGIRTTFH